VGLKAVFVEINKHLDSAIPELGGARRDATALWALFSDTFSDIAARPLLDEDATVAAVSDAIMGSLETATARLTAPLSSMTPILRGSPSSVTADFARDGKRCVRSKGMS
jgi:hypothetical protein